MARIFLIEDDQAIAHPVPAYPCCSISLGEWMCRRRGRCIWTGRMVMFQEAGITMMYAVDRIKKENIIDALRDDMM